MDQKDLITPPNYNVPQQPLPNATASLVLGIISIVGMFCYGIVGLVCGIIGLVLANKDKDLYELEPERYAATSYNSSNAGRICSIIGIVLSSLVLLFIIIYLIIVGSIFSTLIHHR